MKDYICHYPSAWSQYTKPAQNQRTLNQEESIVTIYSHEADTSNQRIMAQRIGLGLRRSDLSQCLSASPSASPSACPSLYGGSWSALRYSLRS